MHDLKFFLLLFQDLQIKVKIEVLIYKKAYFAEQFVNFKILGFEIRIILQNILNFPVLFPIMYLHEKKNGRPGLRIESNL